MKYFVLLLSLLIVFSCSETPIIAPIDHNSSLEGFVRFEDGSPNSITADVTLYRLGETNAFRQTQTDATGFYHFDNLTSGIFQINLSATEFETFTLFDQEVSWREDANKNLLPELIKYNEVIKHNIGLRLQSRLTKEQAKFVARCNSVHRDISLNF